VDLGEVADEIVGADVLRQCLVLGGVADPGPHLRPELPRVAAQHLERAAVGPVHAEHEAEQRRLPGAVGSEEAGDAVADLEGGAGQRRRGAPALRHRLGANDGGHGAHANAGLRR
jgi:hypothetical protein